MTDTLASRPIRLPFPLEPAKRCADGRPYPAGWTDLDEWAARQGRAHAGIQASRLKRPWCELMHDPAFGSRK